MTPDSIASSAELPVRSRRARGFLVSVAVLGLIAASCGADSGGANGPLPTAEPAPTVAGVISELPEPEVQAQAVIVGVPATEAIEIRALPGLDQPIASEILGATRVELMGQISETGDGAPWWQVQVGGVQGWIQRPIAYRAPTQNITEQVLASLGETTFQTSEEAATAIGQQIAADSGAPTVVIVSHERIAGTPTTTMTVDLLGFQDDSVMGLRLLIAYTSASSWRPASVLQAALCARGVSTEGLCL